MPLSAIVTSADQRIWQSIGELVFCLGDTLSAIADTDWLIQQGREEKKIQEEIEFPGSWRQILWSASGEKTPRILEYIASMSVTAQNAESNQRNDRITSIGERTITASRTAMVRIRAFKIGSSAAIVCTPKMTARLRSRRRRSAQ